MRLIIGFLLALSTSVFAATECDIVYSNAVRYGVADIPFSVVTGDFDSDLRPDLATLGEASREVSVLLNRPPGFVHGASVFLPADASALRGMVDVDGDGADDLIAIGATSISTLAGRGNGAFDVRTTSITTEPTFRFAAAADVNADGRADVVLFTTRTTGSTTSRFVHVFLARQDGSFAETGTPAAITRIIRDLAVADVTGDGKPDVVLGDLLLNSTLVLSTKPGEKTRLPLSTTGLPADLDGDGRVDIYSADILRGNGDGTFVRAGTGTTAGPTSSNRVFADFDGDGNVDYAIGTYWSDIAIEYGHGEMRFDGTYWAFTVSPYHETVAADLNHDGRTDLVQVGPTDAQVYVTQSDGTAKFTWRIRNGQTGTAALADFDGDGNIDLYLSGTGLALGNGDGTFHDPEERAGPTTSNAIAAVDLNRDGKLDLVAGLGYQTGIVSFSINDGTGRFTTSTMTTAAIRSLAVADFNRDGTPDVVAAGNNSNLGSSAELYLIDGRGSLPPVKFASGIMGDSIAAGDVDGDGIADVVALTKPIDELLIFGGNGNGTFRTPRRINVPDGTFGAVALGDFSGDGRLDIAVGAIDYNEILVLVQQPDGSFVENAHVPAVAYRVVTGDFDADGRLDLLPSGYSGTAYVHPTRCRQQTRLTQPAVGISASASSTSKGSALTLTATLDPAAEGRVVFYEWIPNSGGGGEYVPVGSAAIHGGTAAMTTTSLPQGVHEIHAVYLGEGAFVRSRSATIEHTVTAAPPAGKRRRSSRH